jgi:hypothetical protein
MKVVLSKGTLEGPFSEVCFRSCGNPWAARAPTRDRSAPRKGVGAPLAVLSADTETVLPIVRPPQDAHSAA